MSAPGDPVEREADRVADRVMRAVAPSAAPTPARPDSTVLRSAPAASPATPSAPAGRTPAPPAVTEAVASAGRPLDSATRSVMEASFGRGFGAVRVHTDRRAQQAAQAVRASAFTVGTDIAFARSRYEPDTPAGARLLAHELAHVLQARGAPRHVLRSEERREPASSAAPGLRLPLGSQPEGGARVFVYDTGDPHLAPVWRAAAEHWAAAHGGLAVASARTGAGTLERIAEAYEEANRGGRYACIRSIEFFGHGVAGATLVEDDGAKFTAEDAEAAAVLDAERVAQRRSLHRRVARLAARAADAAAGAEGGPLQELAEALEETAAIAEAAALQRLRGEGDAAGSGAAEEHLELAERFGRLRGLLCSDSYVHLRTCSSLAGERGAVLGRSLAELLDTHVIGHEVDVDTYLQAWRFFAPGGEEVGGVPEEVRPSARDLPEVPRHLRIEIDLSGLTDVEFPAASRQGGDDDRSAERHEACEVLDRFDDVDRVSGRRVEAAVRDVLGSDAASRVRARLGGEERLDADAVVAALEDVVDADLGCDDPSWWRRAWRQSKAWVWDPVKRRARAWVWEPLEDWGRETAGPWLVPRLGSIHLNAEVLPRPDEPESHSLRITFRGPEQHVHLSEIVDGLTALHASSGASPTLEELETEGRAVIVPIDRTVVERFAVHPEPMAFTIPTEAGDATVTVRPAEEGPSWSARRGGVWSGAEPVFEPGFHERRFARLPLVDVRGAARLSAEAAALRGSAGAAPEAGLAASLHLLDTLHLYASLYGRPGLAVPGGEGRLGLRSGLGWELGDVAGELTGDVPLAGSEGGRSLMLRLRWDFGGP